MRKGRSGQSRVVRTEMDRGIDVRSEKRGVVSEAFILATLIARGIAIREGR